MSIHLRLILTFSVCLSLAYISIALIVFSSTRKSSNEAFRAMAESHLDRVEERIKTFLEPGIMSVKYLATLELVRNSRGKLTSYLDTTEVTTLYYANHPPYEQRIYDEYIRIHNSNENFGLVFMANDDGQYAQAPEGHIKNPGYDPRIRSWYIESIENKAEVTITAPYLTTGGGMVSSIMIKTYDIDNKPLGLVGVDYSLESLTADLNERQIMKTGYLIMFDKAGQILTNGRNPEYISFAPEEYPGTIKQIASSTKGDFISLDQSGRRDYVVTHTIAPLGWKLAVVFDESEMLASSYNLLWTIIVTSGIVFLLAFVILTFLARSIVHPLEQLIDISAVISSGKYEKNDKQREELFQKLSVTGAMENRKLAGSLSSMLSSLEEWFEEISALKDNLKVGIFLMNKGYIIQPAYSKALENILVDDELEGKKFTDILSASIKAKERDILEDYFNMIVNRSFDVKMLEEINPISEFSYINDITGDQKVLRSNFRAVDRGHDQFFIMGTLEDITAEELLRRQLETEETKRQEEMRALFQIVQVDPKVFGDFIEDVEFEFDRINEILKNKKLSARDAMVDIYQSVHAIKSNALILGLENFSGKLHELETEIKNIHDREEISFEDILHFTLDLEKIMKEKDKFKDTINKIQSFGVGSGRRQDRYVLVETLSKACEKASLTLHKKVKFIVEDLDGIVLEYGPRRIIKEVLTQLVRNAVYHGIESPGERQSCGKNPEGLIRLSIKKTGNRIHLKLSDDGKGLDFEKIRRKALSRNILKDTREETDKNHLLQVIFLPGFSTTDNTDTHAGRGIGLNLVRERVRDLHGSIKLQSESGKGTVFNIYIPLDLPQTANKAS